MGRGSPWPTKSGYPFSRRRPESGQHREKRWSEETTHFDVANDGSVVTWGGGESAASDAWIARDAGPRVRVDTSGEWWPRAALSPAGRFLAAPWYGGEPAVVEVASGRRHVLLGAPHAATAVTFSMLGQILAVGTLEGMVVLFDLANGARAEFDSGHDGVVTAVAFSADGALLATGGEDTTVLLARAPVLG